MKNDNIVDEYERSYFLMKLMKFLGLYYYNKARILKEIFSYNCYFLFSWCRYHISGPIKRGLFLCV